jgi:hypothetical protein
MLHHIVCLALRYWTHGQCISKPRSNRSFPGCHAGVGGRSGPGIVNRNSVPCGVHGEAQSRPPCASIILRQIDSPMPMPADLVVNSGSKMR